MSTISQQIYEPEGSPDDFQRELERTESTMRHYACGQPSEVARRVRLRGGYRAVGVPRSATHAAHVRTDAPAEFVESVIADVERAE